jgi:riboflavin biosynthesis pyrimidine reductase
VASASLEFPLPQSIQDHHQPLHIVTVRSADPRRVNDWRDQGHEVLFAGEGDLVEGNALVQLLGSLGYHCLYLIAGPQMLDTMVRTSKLSLLFQTINHQLMGGERFRTLVSGPALGSVGQMDLLSLYFDEGEAGQAGQFFAKFKPRCQGGGVGE